MPSLYFRTLEDGSLSTDCASPERAEELAGILRASGSASAVPGQNPIADIKTPCAVRVTAADDIARLRQAEIYRILPVGESPPEPKVSVWGDVQPRAAQPVSVGRPPRAR